MRGIIILAGGKHKRMKQNKALMKLKGKALINHVLEKVLEFNYKTIVVIGRNDEFNNYSEIITTKAIIVKDKIDNMGPLSGILTGMQHVKTKCALVLPCDSPFIKKEVLEFLFKISEGFDASIPRWPNGYIEPLHAVYQVKKTIKASKNALNNEEFFIRDMIKRLKNINYIDVERFKKLDPDLFTFYNINNREDFEIAERIWNKIINSNRLSMEPFSK